MYIVYAMAVSILDLEYYMKQLWELNSDSDPALFSLNPPLLPLSFDPPLPSLYFDPPLPSLLLLVHHRHRRPPLPLVLLIRHRCRDCS